MATHQETKPKVQRTAKRRKIDTALLAALLAALPPLILALVELLKTGHALGWW